MSLKHQDTYFLDAKTALKVALQANEVETSSVNVKGLQVCYYEAEEPLKDAPQNCIFVPLDNVYNYFVTTKNRFPSEINFDNTQFTKDERELLTTSIHQILYKSRVERAELIDILMKQVKELKPDFNDKKLRVFVPACRETTVIKNISENIAKTFEKMGYEVCFFIQDNAMQGCVDILPYIHTLHEFNPHIIVNINHLNNHYLNDEVFNFVWFQDTMPIVVNKEPIHLRKRDYIFALLYGIQFALGLKGVNCDIQDFCISTDVYKVNKNIQKKQKVVFIGGSYLENYNPYINEVGGQAIDSFDDTNAQLVLKEMINHYRTNGEFTHQYLGELAQRFGKSNQYLRTYLFSYLIRDVTILELCKMEQEYEIEIYGWGWEKYPELQKYYKGALSYGEAISNVYNSADYAIVAHPDYIIQQRTLEAAASGCTPLVYDCRYSHLVEPPYFEESVVYFKNLVELEQILNQKKQERDLKSLVEQFSYEKFVKNMGLTISKVLK